MPATACPSRAARWYLLIALASVSPLALQGQIAVITNLDSPIQDLTLEELSQVFLGQVTETAGARVTLAEHSPVRAAFYRAVAGLAEPQVDRHWIGVVIRGGEASPPRKLSDAAAVRDFVAANPGAIAFLSLDYVDSSVKVVTVDGRGPSEPDYPIYS